MYYNGWKEELKDPTGLILRQLGEGKVTDGAKYQIRRAKENLKGCIETLGV